MTDFWKLVFATGHPVFYLLDKQQERELASQEGARTA